MTRQSAVSRVSGVRRSLTALIRVVVPEPFDVDRLSIVDTDHDCDSHNVGFDDMASTEEGPPVEFIPIAKKTDLITGSISVPTALVALVPALIVVLAFIIMLNFAWESSSDEVTAWTTERNLGGQVPEPQVHQAPVPTPVETIAEEPQVASPAPSPKRKKKVSKPKPPEVVTKTAYPVASAVEAAKPPEPKAPSDLSASPLLKRLGE